MVIPLIIRGAGMAAKGAKNFGSSAKNVAQAGWQNAPNIGGAIQQGWQKVPGSAKIGAGAGLMTGLAVGGARGFGKGHGFVKNKISEKDWFILLFPIILVAMDFIFNQNGIELNSFFGWGGNVLFAAIISIVSSAPYWASVLIYWVFRRPQSTVEWIYPFAFFLMGLLTLAFGNGNPWILYHSLFALFTFVYLLEGFNQDVQISRSHWIFLVIMFMDIFGLATITKLFPDVLGNIVIPEFFLNRLLFPLWFFFYLSMVKKGAVKNTIFVGLILLYTGLGLSNLDIVDAAFAQTNLDAQKKEFTTGTVKAITNWRDYATQWLTGRINYAITGKVEENQFEPIGVYLENVQAADQKYYLDEDVIVWGTVKARTLDDPINIKVGCFVEMDKKKLPANDVDPKKKFSVFTLEEQDFACTFNGTRNGVASKLKEGTNTVKAFADFNFETLSYLKVYFIDKERQRAMTREGLDIFEEFDITDRNPVAVYTNGPAKIEMGTTNPIVGVSESYPAEPSLGIDISNREGWQGKITKLKELVIFLPDGIDFDKQASCNKEFTNYKLNNIPAGTCEPPSCKTCVQSCENIVQKECLEVCEGDLITSGECDKICKEYPSGDRCSKCTDSVKKLNACNEIAINDKTKCKDTPLAKTCIDCKKGVGINNYNFCTDVCEENFDRCTKSCNFFFEEGAQKYNGYSLKPDEYKGEKDFEKGIQLRCRFRPQPSILGNAPLTTKSFRVKARYDYNVEKSVSVNIQKDETSGGEGNVGAPLNLRIKGSGGALVSAGIITLENIITIVWDKSINDGGGSNDVIRYRVYRKDGDSGKFNKKGEVDAKGTASYEYKDESVSLSGNFKYSYYVDALNRDNKFEKSAVILEVTPGKVGSIGQEGGAVAPSGPVVMLYEDKDYKGNVLSIKGDVSDLGAVDFKATSSFRINDGYVGTLYEHKDFRGQCFSDVISRPDLGKIVFGSGQTMNDAVSSIKVSNFKGAVLYADKDYQGLSSYYGSDDNSFNDDCGGNRVSSIRVAPDYRAIIFRDADFNGVSGEADCNDKNIRCVDNGIADFGSIDFNDEPSSIRIVKKASGGVVAPKLVLGEICGSISGCTTRENNNKCQSGNCGFISNENRCGCVTV